MDTFETDPSWEESGDDSACLGEGYSTLGWDDFCGDVEGSSSSSDSGYLTETLPSDYINPACGWNDSCADIDGSSSSNSGCVTETLPEKINPECGWNDSCADIDGSISSDSGCVTETPPHEATKYIELPFRTKHYFHTYVQRILEATCVRYARAHLTERLSDLEWKKSNLLFHHPEYPNDRFVERDWLAEDGIELEFWMRTLCQSHIRPYVKGDAKILNAVWFLRNEAVHRGDREGGPLSWDDLFDAMKFPARMGDSQGHLEIENAFRYVTEDSTLDQDTRASVERAMYTPQPCTTRHQLLGRIQTLLEETCFNYARSQIPEHLARMGLYMYEQVELNKWSDIHYAHGVTYDKSADAIFPNMNEWTLKCHLNGARVNIRNVVAHRAPLSSGKVVTQVHCAIYLCIIQADWNQAIEVEILAEMFFTGASRGEVLSRLESVYRDGRCRDGKFGIAAYERERRVAVRGLLEREGIEVPEEDDDDENKLAVGTTGFGDEWIQNMWSHSMHECLLKLEDKYVMD